MIRKYGDIGKVLYYYFTLEHRSYFGREIDQAENFFFDVWGKPISPEEFGHFSEWFIFVFKLANGQTPLERFCDTNPFHLLAEELVAYQEQRTDHHYGAFEITAVRHGQGLSLRDLLTGRDWDVVEVSATRQVIRGNVLFARLAKRGGHYEMTGGSTLYIPAPAPEIRPFLDDYAQPLDPREIFLAMKKGVAEDEKKEAKKKVPSIADLDLTHAGIEIVPLSGGRIEIVGSYAGPSAKDDDGCVVCRVLVSARKQGVPPDPEKLRGALEQMAWDNQESKNNQLFLKKKKQRKQDQKSS